MLIDRLCSAFLWSGPSLNARKTKVPWSDVCLPKSEGGLGLRSIEVANKVSMLKLIWRISSARGSLWVDWVKRSLIRSGSFWAEKDNTMCGSWIWRKLLKYRSLAKQFIKMEVHNGESTSFWFDNWSSLGCLYDVLGERGFIDLRIPKTSTVANVLTRQRRQRHRFSLLNTVEDEIEKLQLQHSREIQDVPLWKGKNDTYRNNFNTKETWSHIHISRPQLAEYKVIWFSQATPKYAFLTWLIFKNRVTTGDRLQQWSPQTNASCIFCNHPLETRDHLFFQCSYSQLVWEGLVKRLLANKRSPVTLHSGLYLSNYHLSTLARNKWKKARRTSTYG